ncbi:MAG: hypothetical protein K2L05_06860 [Muribaculaceae bacterium]|nr:hypothetical protein [Muribaculaceae bacterium]
MKYKYLIAAAAVTMMACSSNKADNANQTAETLSDSSTVEQPAPQTPDDILLPELAAEIYSRILNYTDETLVFISEHCTPELLKQLSDAYDMDGEGYAIWLLRSGAQDGDGESKVVSTTFIAPNTVEIEFSDMGFQCKRMLTFEKRNGQWLLNEVTLPNGLSVF